jgi:NAD(P)-dependent dehydrogenase (short-subunit alcohol dehydrogenase family)
MDIDGTTALITGGASGLGAGTARALAEAGARVAVLDLNAELGEAVAAEIGGLSLRCDVTSAEDVEAAVGAAAEAHGPARILVNCAGTAIAVKTVSRGVPHPLDAFERIIAVNLVGSFNCIRVAAAAMTGLEPLADGERGVIVNTASAAAFEGQVGQVACAASKGGVVGMTLPIARDLARDGIRVCTIAPGLFETPLMLGTLNEEYKASLAASIPFPQRFGEPAEFGAMVRHIAENTMLNGETIRLDGAIRMAPR